MTPHADQYFALIVPGGVALMGVALLVCWRILRRQQSLPWLATGYLLPSVALAAQSLMSNDELARWSVVCASAYLGGTWCLAHGMALRHGTTAHPRLALLFACLTLGILYYYSRVHDLLWVRAFWLNVGLSLMLLMPVRGILRTPPRDRLDRLLRGSYLVAAGYTAIRCIPMALMLPSDDVEMLTRSVYWQLMLSSVLFFSIWFMLVLLASTVREVMLTLREERDHDPLTQLLNRRAFFELADVSLHDPRQGPWMLLMGDLDHFKRINDELGHATGDRVLQAVGQLLAQQVRRNDLVARFGGEEFVVLLVGAELAQAEDVAQRVRLQLANTHLDGLPGPVTGSFGLTPVRHADDLAAALVRADALLYQAKAAGRNQVCADTAGPAVATPAATTDLRSGIALTNPLPLPSAMPPDADGLAYPAPAAEPGNRPAA